MRTLFLSITISLFGHVLYGFSEVPYNESFDTTYIYFNISYFGEFGSVNEGLIIINKGNSYVAKYVQYENDTLLSVLSSLTSDEIMKYFSVLQSNYRIIKDAWILDSIQLDYLQSLLISFKDFKPSNDLSNAVDFYLFKTSQEDIVVIDKSGTWDKYKEVQECMGVKVIVPRRLYFLGIKLRERKVDYIVF